MSRHASPPGYASSPSRATLSASSTKLRTAGRSSPARQATHNDVTGTFLAGTKTRPGRRGGGKARLLGDRDEVPQMPQFDVHRERNPNRRVITATVDTIASRRPDRI